MTTGNNPIDFSDLFNFNDQSTIEKGINGIKDLKKTYTDFFNSVIGGQFQRLAEQETLLIQNNAELLKSTQALSAANKQHQQTLQDNLKAAQQLKADQDALKRSRDDAKKTDQAAGDAVKSLIQQYKSLRVAYEQAFLAGDTKKMADISAKARQIDADIKKMNSTLRATKEVFQSAAGSYAALDAENKKLINNLKNMPGAFDKSNKAAKELKAQIYANTTQLKSFDQQINQNFRNVGNYKDALAGVGNQFKQFALGYLSLQAGFALLGRVVDQNALISDSLADVRRTAGLTAKEVEHLEAQLKQINTRTSLKGLFDIAVIGGQLGIAKDQLGGFTKAVDQLSVALKGELEGGPEEVAKALGILNNVFDITAQTGGDVEKAFQKIGSVILHLGQSGLATGDFLADFGERVGGIAAQARISLPVLLSYGAVLQENGVSAEVAGTAMKKLIGSLASKRDKFFAVAQIADGSLTLKEFTRIINTDTQKALSLFFEGLKKGGPTTTAFIDLLKSVGLDSARAGQAITALALHQEELNVHIKEETKVLQDGTLATEQAALKNDTLGASLEKLVKEFDNALTSGGATSFFKSIIDGATDAIKWVEKLWQSESKAELLDKLLVFTPKARDNADDKYSSRKAIQNYYYGADTKAAELNQQAPVNGAGTVTGLAGKSELELKKLTEAYTLATTQAARAKDKYNEQIKKGNLAAFNDPNVPANIDTVTKLYNTLQNRLYQVAKAYNNVKAQADAARNAQAGGPDAKKDSQLNSEKEIRARIRELQDDALKNPKNKADDIARILALKARLKELSGTVKEAKDGFAALEAEISKLTEKIQDRVLKGQKIAQDDPMIVLLRKEQAKLYAAKKALEDLLRGPASFPLPPPIPDADPHDPKSKGSLLEQTAQGQLAKAEPGYEEKIRKENAVKAIADYQDQLDKFAQKYADYNKDLIFQYQHGLITKQQYDALTLESAQKELEGEHFLNKNILAQRLTLYKEGSKEWFAIRKQQSDLEVSFGKKEIDDAEAKEAKRRELIKTTFDMFSKTLPALSKQLGEGYAEVFQTLTNVVQDFALNQKLSLQESFQVAGDLANAFTQIYNDASNARITQLQAEEQNALSLAGNNKDAKAAIEKRYNKEVAAEKTKQAKADKANALFQIAIGTAVAVVNALSIPIYGEVLAGIIAALGAAELAIVAAKPIPKFGTGRSGGPAMRAIVNDRGPELLERKGKFRMAGGGKETVTTLQEGEIVHTAQETERIFQKKIMDNQMSEQFVNSLIKGTGIVRDSEAVFNDKVVQAIAKHALSVPALTDAFTHAMDSRPSHETIIDKNGFHEFLVAQNMRIKLADERHRTGGNG